MNCLATYDDVLSALADSTRRSILEILMEHDTKTAGQLADEFPHISRPAVSRHLRVLRETGLIVEEKQGREIHYRLHHEPLLEVEQWLRRFSGHIVWN